ncbi:hypothetical protein [Salinicoccus roseus]|uniref:hypothetical protein n=1 Tax=Salinicoccus roseus TaxID=45670 RepID=UPI000F96D413|nr:hypothetical protein EDC33_0774 [Salinicoccus roseus]GGA64905.1 hypothetical protein GCM10007176_06630 [Salinicoccus roseus]
MDKKKRGKVFGFLSILTAVISILFLLITRGPNTSLISIIIVFTVFSVLGIIFAIISKNLWFIIIGIILNGTILVYAFFLFVALGIGGTP